MINVIRTGEVLEIQTSLAPREATQEIHRLVSPFSELVKEHWR
jgi:hypothetical protein